MAIGKNYKKLGKYESFIKLMIDNLINIINKKDDVNEANRLKTNNITPMDYYVTKNNQMELIVCPEPKEFISVISKEKDTEKKKVFANYIKEKVKKYQISKPENNYWFNKSVTGINLRFGNLNGDSGNQEPVTMGDNCVHGVLVGTSGSGKSVLINNILLNLMTEYAPWELDLYLIDMKKVELSRYMAPAEKDKTYLAPHVKACAATSEVRYVVSMIEHIYNCMKAREKLFADLNVKDIKSFRETYSEIFGVDFVLPQILLLVDEFQTMFSDARGKEKAKIEEYITSITKLGRALGVHLFFASQNMMGNAVPSNLLTDFQLRIAKGCEKEVSQSVLGNSEAGEISKEDKETTIVRTNGSGNRVEDNRHYKNPYIIDKRKEENELSEFEIHLNSIHDLSNSFGIKKNQQFYQEDYQKSMDVISKIKSNVKITKQIENLQRTNLRVIDAIILGTDVLYNEGKNDYKSIFIEKGKKRNIGILCSKDNDVGNVLKMLVENFKYSNHNYVHSVVFANEIYRSVYNNMISDLNFKDEFSAIEYNYDDFISSEQRDFISILSSLDYSNKSIKNVFIELLYKILFDISKKFIEDIDPTVNQFDKNLIKQVKDTLNELVVENDNEIVINTKNKLVEKMQNEINSKQPTKATELLLSLFIKLDSSDENSDLSYCKMYEIFDKSIKSKRYDGPIKINWIVGTDDLDKKEDNFLPKIMETCTNNNEYFVLAGADPENLDYSYKCCNYLFINTPNDEKLYNKYNMNYTKKEEGNKTIDFKVINYNQEICFKQFKYKFNVEDIPKINFDEIED